MLKIKSVCLLYFIKMDLVVSETNKGKKTLLYEGFTYRIDFVLKSEDTNVYHGNVPREAVKRNLERIRT